MDYISLNTAISITGLSKRTLWRRIAEGVLRTDPAVEPGERTRVAVDDVAPLARLSLTPALRELAIAADGGLAEAQCDLGLTFLAEGLDAEGAAWLALAANQAHLDAMHWLGRCLIAGRGVVADEKGGVDWIARAANYGHVSARAMVQYLYDPARPALGPAELEAALDAIERRVVFEALEAAGG